MNPRGEFRDLGVRTLSALVLATLGLTCLAAGG